MKHTVDYMQNITHQSGWPDKQNHNSTLKVQRNEIFKQELFSTSLLKIRSLFWQSEKKTKRTLWQIFSHCRVHVGTPVMISSGHITRMTRVIHVPEVILFKVIFSNFRFWTSFLFLCLYVNVKHTEKQCSVVVKPPNSGDLPQVA